MADRAADPSAARPRPRPNGVDHSAGPSSVGSSPSRRRRPGRPSVGKNLTRIEPATAGSALVTVGRVGRLLTRTSWRITKQVPGVALLESQARRMSAIAAAEANRLMHLPQQVVGAGATPEEQRVMTLVQDAHADPEPLRTAMTELLDRSAASDGEASRDYLFGTIVSQLVPDEARMLAALATGRQFAAVDVLARESGRSGKTRAVLSNASTLGAAAGVAVPASTPTYLTRLEAFGLVDFGSPDDGLSAQYESLRSDQAVREARDKADHAKNSSAKVTRKTVRLSPLGREFWSACSPPTPPNRPTQRRSG